MPNGGHSNISWGPQWFPSAALGCNQMQGIGDINSFNMVAAQQLSNQYGAPVPWNDASTQAHWVQWQSNVHTK